MKKHFEQFLLLVMISYNNSLGGVGDDDDDDDDQMMMKMKIFYSQTRSGVPPKNPLMNLLFKSWIRC